MSYNLVDPTTGDLTRVAGNSFSIQVGTLIQQYKKKPISGFLYCDGSTFDENAYPALYMYLGTNVLPDYRECVMVGAEQNTTDTIATHDVYTEGEFKDDQMQGHRHQSPNLAGYYADQSTGRFGPGQFGTADEKPVKNPISDGKNGTPRTGSTTHGKQKAVYIYIKATSGLGENQQENVLNDTKNYINNSNSYSTDEVKTGGKWIDGKPIYRKVFYSATNWANGETLGNIENLDTVITISSTSQHNNGNWFTSYDEPNLENIAFVTQDGNVIITRVGSYLNNLKGLVIVEYTKTTD